MEVTVRRLRVEDIDAVVEIEREAFSPTWVGTPFKRELSNRYAKYLMASCREAPAPDRAASVAPAPVKPKPWGWLARWFGGKKGNGHAAAPTRDSSSVAGYVGIWFQGDEAHITEIAVRERLRGQGIGELLLIGSVRAAVQEGSGVLTLEVRVSNFIAQRLYEKYGFKAVGTRKAYYADNREDATIMTTSPIHSPEYQKKFVQLQEDYQSRWRPISIEM
ncbi:MAG: ribosomal-protein-alanine N-acetyltransferase [SAR202 cluster bacterium]|nr:ribosomal-protein-alanine N-acetyltransferase [SAR202 cluster bacterium]